MAQEYSLQSFIRDMHNITGDENSPAKIVAAAQPLLAKLVQRPDCVEPKFKQRPTTEYGRYMLHRAPRFNVTAVVWGPGDAAKAHNHDTWGLVGVVENEIQETRFRRLDDGSKSRTTLSWRVKDVSKNSAGTGFLPGCRPTIDIHEMNNVSEIETLWKFTCTAKIWRRCRACVSMSPATA